MSKPKVFANSFTIKFLENSENPVIIALSNNSEVPNNWHGSSHISNHWKYPGTKREVLEIIKERLLATYKELDSYLMTFNESDFEGDWDL
jgi:hypothetical protein